MNNRERKIIPINNNNNNNSNSKRISNCNSNCKSSVLFSPKVVKQVLTDLLAFWNELVAAYSHLPGTRRLRWHRRILPEMEKAIISCLKDEEDIEDFVYYAKDSITNYAKMLANESGKYCLTKRWSFAEFLTTKSYLDVFYSYNEPLSNEHYYMPAYRSKASMDELEQQNKERGLREAARNCLRINPGCYSNSEKEVCVVCRKYR